MRECDIDTCTKHGEYRGTISTMDGNGTVSQSEDVELCDEHYGMMIYIMVGLAGIAGLVVVGLGALLYGAVKALRR